MNKQPFLVIDNLKKEYGDITAVDGVSFFIEEGESIGIVGESGCGKSTLARLITGLEKPTGGKVLLWGNPYHLKSKGREGCQINMVFQDPIDSFDPHMTVFSSLYEALSHTTKIRKKDAWSVIEDALQKVELPSEYSRRRISQLSGGECQRIGIARAVLTEPDLLICDEATSALDVSVQAQIIHLLQRLKKNNHYSYIFISHDLALVSCMCSRVLVMYKGRLVEESSVKEIMTHPQHPYTKLLVSCGAAFTMGPCEKIRTLPKIAVQEGEGDMACGFYPFCRQHMEVCKNKVPVYKEFDDGHKVACHLFQ